MKFEVEQVKECPSCGCQNAKDWLVGQDMLLKLDDRKWPYAQCECGTYFLKERPTENTVGYFYQGNYAPYGKGGKSKFRFPRLNRVLLSLSNNIVGTTQILSLIQDKYRAALQQNTIFIDYGCGSEKYLNKVRKIYGCDTIGMDFNPEVVEQVRQHGHKALVVSPESWSQIADGSVKMVRMNHVLEHLYGPAELLSQLLAKLTEGGLIHISVPNPTSEGASRYKGSWLGLDSPRHVMLYSPEAVKNMLTKVGFEDVNVYYEPAIKDVLRSKSRFKGEREETGLIENGYKSLACVPEVCQHKNNAKSDRFHVIAVKSATK